MSAYADTIAYLQGLEVSRGWDLKLDRMHAALALRGHPEARVPALHIAGTNGKGSTAAMVEAVLRAAGHRTGLYTSPHLLDFAERIRAGGLAMPHATIVELVRELRGALDAAGIALTHFEFATLLALEWFARIGIEVGVIEVGLGGRLDATNVLRPLATAITTIALDHEEFLGPDLVSIAGEKAGIAKPGVPLVVGAVSPEASAVILAHARAVGAPVVSSERDAALVEDARNGLAFRGPGGVTWEGLRIGLAGAFQRENARVALTMLACVQDRVPCSPGAVRTGLRDTWWPGRLTVLRQAPLVVVDGAHNPAGTDALVRELDAVMGDRDTILVFAVMADKAWRVMLERLLPHVRRTIVTRVGRRGLDPTVIAPVAAARVPTEVIADPCAAVRAAVEAARPHAAVLVAGSLFLVGDAYRVVAGGGDLVQPWQGWERIGTQARP